MLSLLRHRTLFSILFLAALGSFAGANAAESDPGMARVRQVPAINGGATVEGSLHVMSGGEITLNGGATITRDLLVPGIPVVRINGKPSYGGTLDGSGPGTPANYTITLNGHATLRNVIRRTAPLALSPVPQPPAPTGARSVTLGSATQSVGDWATLRNLTLNGNAGQIAVPPGTYGDFVANGGSGLTLGIAGATTPAVYNLQRLTLNAQARIDVVGPVTLNLANGLAANGTLGSSARPDWLALNLASGGLTLNGGCAVYAYVNAPATGAGVVLINGNATLVGGLIADQLVINGGGLLRLRQGAGAGPVNTAPVANSQTLSTPEDVALALTLSASDAENDALSYQLVSPPTEGVLTYADGTAVPGAGLVLASTALRYTPGADFIGADSVAFRVRDAAGLESNLATISIAVTPVNDLPVATPLVARTFEDTPVEMALAGNDPEGSALTYMIVAGPARGSLTGEPPTLTYRPNADFSGVDVFSYTVTDADGGVSAPASVTITVDPVNDAPVAQPQSLELREDEPILVQLAAIDAEGQALSYVVATLPSHGTLTLVDGSPLPALGDALPASAAGLVRYVPGPNFNGADVFTFSASDGELSSAPAAVHLNVLPVDDLPIAAPQRVVTAEDTPVAITLTGAVVPGGAAPVYRVTTQPAHGTLGGSGADLVYRPALNFFGTDRFLFTVTDAVGESEPAEVVIEITSVNDAPVAFPFTARTSRDREIALLLAGADAEGGAITINAPAATPHGTLAAMAGQWIYRPAAGFTGTDEFTFTVSDGELVSAPAVVRVIVSPDNAPPVVSAGADRIVSLSEGAVRLKGFATDDGLPVSGRLVASWSLVEPTASATISDAERLDGVVAFNAAGMYRLRLTANDGVLSASDEFTLTVVQGRRPVITSAPVTLMSFPLAESSTAEVEMTVRDFKQEHPDFEDGISGLTKGLVQAGLDAERKPVFAASAGQGSITSAETFAQWYRDVPGVNLATTVRLPLSPKPGSPSVLQYSNSRFFPIDGLLFGNEGRDRNFHFTAEWHGEFTYRGGEVFAFNGDDDIWVFINNRLVIDLGGVHGAESGSVDLDTLGLVRGRSYPIDLFFAERHTSESNFHLETTLTLNGSGVYHYDVAATDPDGDALTYRLLTAPTGMSIDPATGRITWPVGKNEIGWAEVAVEVADVTGLTAVQSFSLQIMGNERPLVTAPAFVTARPGVPAQLTAQAVDDGLPAGSTLSTLWSVASGEGDVALGSPESLTTSAVFSAPGIYQLEFTATDSEIVASTSTTVRVAASCDALPAGVVAWWPLNGDFVDLVTNTSLDGNGVFSAGHVGQSLVPARADQGLKAQGRQDLDLAAGDGFTVELWFDPLLQGSPENGYSAKSGRIWGWGNPSGIECVAAVRHQGGLDFQVTLEYSITGAGQHSFGVETLLQPGFNHLAITYDAEAARFAVYVNGAFIGGRDELPGRPQTAGLFSLNWSHWSDGFGGKYDEVALYNRALSEPEIAGLVALGRAGKCPSGINRAPVVRAGTYRTALLGAVESLPATVTDDGLPTGVAPVLTWSVLSEPAPGSVLFDDLSSAAPRVVFRATGTYKLRLVADDGELEGSDLLTVLVVAPANQAPQVNVGDDLSLSLDSPLNLRPSVSDDALPAGRVLTHSWSLVSGPAPVLWGNASARDTTVVFRAAGTYVLRLEVSDGELSGADQVVVTVAAAANVAPTVNLGADRSFAPGETISLPTPAITDDGRPSGALSYQWARISGPAVTFDDATRANPAITFSGPGVYVLRLTVSDGALSAYDEIQITLQPGPNQAPAVNVGQDVTLPLNGLLRIEASVVDDGQPLGRTLAYAWSQLSFTPAVSGGAGGSAAIVPDPLDPANPLKRQLTFDQPGVYRIELSVTEWLDGAAVLVGRDELAVTVDVPVNAAPYVHVGDDITIPVNATLRVPAVVSNDDGLPAGAALTASWSKRSGPGVVTFAAAPDARDQFDTAITFSAQGTYVLRLTASDGALSAFDELTVIVGPAGNAAPQVSLGADLELSRDTVLHARPVVQDDGLPAGNTLAFSWTEVSAPAGGAVAFGSANSRDTTLTFSAVGTYVVRLTASDGVLSGQDELTLHVTSPLNRAPVVAAGPDVSLVENQTLLLNGAAADDELPLNPGHLTYRWEVVPAADAAHVSFVDDAGLPATPDALVQRVRFSRAGAYTLRLTASDGELTSEPDDLLVTVGPRENQAPRISAPAAVTAAPDTARVFPFSVTDDGLPAGVALSYRWSQTDASGSAIVFGNPDAADCTLLFPAPGVYAVALTVTEGHYGAGGLSATHTYTVTVEGAANQAPLVAAALGSDSAIAGQPVALVAAALDDGQPVGAPLAYAWAQVSGPAAATFANASALETSVTFPVAGSYVLRLSVSDSELTGSADVAVTVAPPTNLAPVVSLPAPFTAALGSASTLRSAVTDDGLPAGSALSYAWSFTSDRADNVRGLVFGTPASADTVATFAQPGTYTLTLTVSDGALTTVATTTVTVAGSRNQPPAILATFPPARILAGSAELYAEAIASDPDGDAVAVDFVAAGPAPATTERRVTDTTAPFRAEFTALAPGVYTFYAVARDTRGAALETPRSTVTILPADTTIEGSVAIVAPVDDDTITAPVAVTGFAQDPDFASYRLQYRAAAETAAPWIDFASGSSPVGTGSTAGALGTFDPGLLRNGLYDLRLVLATASGAELISDTVRVSVDGRRKVGVFSVAFRDLSLPLAGLPVEITRSYDSRDRATPGDFGHGWKLGLNALKVRKNRALGRDWLLDVQTFDAYGNTYSLYTLDPDTPPSGARAVKHLVTLAFPDDTLHTFEAYLDVQTGTAASAGAALASLLFGLDLTANQSFTFPITEARVRFRPANTRTRGTLELVDTAPAWLVEGASPGSVQLRTDYDPDAPVFDATRFRYTTDDGTVYLLNERDGLESITDLQGNRLELVRDSATGRVSQITHSSGQAVVINRDPAGRVESLRDPYGAYLDYVYDNHGDLIGVLDRAEAFTTYEYYTGSTDPRDAHLAHYLKNIVDPRGTLALRNEYDDEGRLVSQLDAAGHPVEFIRDEANVEKIVDRLGHVTRHEYDAEGNVTRTVHADGSVLLYAYEDPANPTSVTAQTDPLGHVTRYTYDASGRVLTQTDPLGRTTATTYDERGNPLTVTDARGHAATNEYHPADASRGYRGQPKKLVDAAQNETQFLEYDARGNLRALRDASGAETRSTYDSQDRLLTQTVGYRSTAAPGVTTTYDYDDFGRVETETRTVTGADLVARTLVTGYEYDGEGRLTRTYLPGHTADAPRFTGTDYDENGKPVALTDELGRVTTHDYDERGHLIRTTYPPVTIGSSLPAPGSVLTATYTEEFAYDAEGRRILAKDRADRWTRTCYDAIGRVIATYHLGDAIRTREQALAAAPGAGTLLSAARYDAAGRLTDSYDALGNRTAYAYDAAGRRTRTTPPGATPAQLTVNAAGDALVLTRDGDLDPARATVTTYDEAGNVATVTDARGHTTRYLYDELNRRTETIFPDQTRQREAYDALGRRVESVDAEGRITRYGYDNLGRLTTVTDARLQTTSYGYDEAGRQTTQTDALGRVTRYAYDEQGRRVSRTLPDGKAERYFYDEAGNLKSRKDFMGRTTTFTYDELNRLVAKSADPQHPSRAYSHAIVRVEYDYDANGQREAARTYNAAGELLYVEDTPRDERGRIDYKDTSAGRLDYDYYANDLLKEVVSSNEGGVNIGYRYDASSRLAYVDDASGDQPARTTAYTYNPVGSLESVATSGGLTHSYDYDSLNRLTSLGVKNSLAQTLRSYAYTLTPTGRRSTVTESTGRAVTYAYDATYRLTSETISGAGAQNGIIGYTLDAVGNRLARSSSVSAIPATSNTYNVRDWLNTDTYDANGNTLVGQTAGLASSPAAPDAYDFEDRLIVRRKADGSTVNLSYDADGIRIGKTILNASSQLVSATSYLVCTNNLTGYTQVMEERTTAAGGTTLKAYAYGSDLLSVATQAPGSSLPAPRSFFVYDGGGSVRALTDESGAITDTWDYDAFGNLLGRTGTSDNAYLYRGEQFDADLGQYYLRARFYNPFSGRFWNQDTYEGANEDPASLHKYLYAHADPANRLDPSGHMTLVDIMTTTFTYLNMASKLIVAFQVGYLGGSALRLTYDEAYEVEEFLDDALDLGYGIATSYFAGKLGGWAFKRFAGPIARSLVTVIGQRSVQLGRAAEQWIISGYNLFKNNRTLAQLGGRGDYIPDGITNTLLREVKNVGRLRFDAQLSAFANFARETGRKYVIHVRPGTTGVNAVRKELEKIFGPATRGRLWDIVDDVPEEFAVTLRN